MKTDILVVGGGLAGCATAFYLARSGAEVTLIEQFDLNTQASGSNAGSIHAQIPHGPFVENGDEWARQYAPTIPLMIASIKLWERLGEEIGADLGVSITGGLLVAETAAEMRDVERKAALEREHGLPVELLSRGDLRRHARLNREGLATARAKNVTIVEPDLGPFKAAARRSYDTILAEAPEGRAILNEIEAAKRSQ